MYNDMFRHAMTEYDKQAPKKDQPGVVVVPGVVEALVEVAVVAVVVGVTVVEDDVVHIPHIWGQ